METKTRIRLTCGHAVAAETDDVEIGDKVECHKCSTKDGVLRRRLVKAVVGGKPTPASASNAITSPDQFMDAARQILTGQATSDDFGVPEAPEPEPETSESTELPAPDDEDVPGHLRPFHTHPDLKTRGEEGHAHPLGREHHVHVDLPNEQIETVGTVEDGAVEQHDVMAAREEWRALRDWQNSGQKGERPATANLDAMNTAHAAGRPKNKGRKASGGGRQTTRGTRGAEAAARSKQLNNKRGRGRKVTDDELVEYVRTVRRDHPESSRNDEQEYAYWIESIALSWKRWKAAWDRVTVEVVADAVRDEAAEAEAEKPTPQPKPQRKRRTTKATTKRAPRRTSTAA